MKITNEVKTAILAILAIILLIFGYSYLKGNNLLKSNRVFYAKYNNVEGLAKSSKVTVNGLKIGTVSDIKLLGQSGNLLVTMNIENNFEFSKESIARIYGGGLIGGKSIEIVPNRGEKAETGDTLQSDIEEGLLELVNEKLTPLQKKIENTVVSADSLVTGVNQIIDADTRKSIKRTLNNLEGITSSFKGASEKLNRILEKNAGKLDRTFTNLDKMSANFGKVSDSISKIDIHGISRDLEGAIADFKDVSADFKRIATDLDNGKGTAGKLLNDDAVYNNLDRATKQMEELMQDIKLHPKRYVHFSVFGKNDGPYRQPKDSLK